MIHVGDHEEHDPYIEVSPTEMVYYVNDEVNKDWNVVVHLKPKDLYDMGEQGDTEVYEDHFQIKTSNNFLGTLMNYHC